MTLNIDYGLIKRFADVSNDSPFWGSALNEKAEELQGLIASRSWQDDECQADRMGDWIAYEYAEFLRLLKNVK
jgi:hypothetical protein